MKYLRKVANVATATQITTKPEIVWGGTKQEGKPVGPCKWFPRATTQS